MGSELPTPGEESSPVDEEGRQEPALPEEPQEEIDPGAWCGGRGRRAFVLRRIYMTSYVSVLPTRSAYKG